MILKTVRSGVEEPKTRLQRDELPQSQHNVERRAVTFSPVPQRLHHFFEATCDRVPNAVAVEWGREKVSYRELDSRANRLAHYLNQVGIGHGSRVGIMLERSISMYVALISVLKADAVWVPLDPSYPPDRVTFIARDAELAAILTTSSLSALVAESGCRVLILDQIADEIGICPSTRLQIEAEKLEIDELCYIIYTSGTTGQPKGVAIEHRNICNYFTVIRDVYRFSASDRVYQGITLAFDFSLEEIWLTLIAGATIVAGPNGASHYGGAELAKFLNDKKVTVLLCVPTLLMTMVDQDLPFVRLLIVGGEQCPQDLVTRWSHPWRRMLNTYGPTETTITATVSELLPNRPVTIGRPLPTYRVHILGPDLKPVTSGEVGEIHVGGPGVARGYINRPELTREKFISDLFAADPNERLFKTGDLGRMNEVGEVEFFGRSDTQVKVRGYRIELSEIESVILEAPEVQSAVVVTRTPNGDTVELVAYVVPSHSDKSFNLVLLLYERLRSRLPSYMIPAYIEVIDRLPLLANGKIDRSHLPASTGPRLSLAITSEKYAPPASPLERTIAEVWAVVFRQERISVEDDFFLDLGGHSMLAALAVSALRRDERMKNLSIGDIYAHPTVRALAHRVYTLGFSATGSKETNDKVAAAQIQDRASSSSGATTITTMTTPASSRRVWSCGLAQMLAIFLYLMIFFLPLIPVLWTGLSFLSLGSYSETLAQLPSFVLVEVGDILFVMLIVLITPIALNRLLLTGRSKPGHYPLWGSFFLRWWLVHKTQELGSSLVGLLVGSPLMPLYLRLLGAKIGSNCYIGTSELHSVEMIELGEGTSIGVETQIYGYAIRDGMLHLDRVTIGSDCYVGTDSVILPRSAMGDGARLGNQSLLAEGQNIPAGESWSGSPVRPDQFSDSAVDILSSQAQSSPPPILRTRVALYVGHVFAAFGVALVEALAFMPGILLMLYLYLSFGGIWFLLSAPIGGILFVVCLCLTITTLKRIFTSSISPGLYSIHSGFYLRKWIVDALMDMSLGMMTSLYGTLYLLPWLRSLGVSVGHRSEVSTLSHITPNLLSIGPQSFIADDACVGPAPVYKGHFILAPTSIGRRSFIGNSACLPANSSVPDGCLIGVLSIAPGREAKPGTTWLGSPCISLTRRQGSQPFPETQTFSPAIPVYALRLFVEFFRILLPPTIWLASSSALVVLTLQLFASGSFLLPLLSFPLLYLLFSTIATLSVVGIKRALIGTYQPAVQPQWSLWVRKTELVTGLYENVTVPMLLDLFTGTPFAPLILRLFGVKIGRRVFIDTTYVTEFDLVSVGDDSQISPSVTLQTHLFEDNVMKTSHVRVGRGCSIGPRGVVLYDSEMEDYSSLDGLSLLMKGESLPAYTHWRGALAHRYA